MMDRIAAEQFYMQTGTAVASTPPFPPDVENRHLEDVDNDAVTAFNDACFRLRVLLSNPSVVVGPHAHHATTTHH